jgi:hypothetical protein
MRAGLVATQILAIECLMLVSQAQVIPSLPILPRFPSFVHAVWYCMLGMGTSALRDRMDLLCADSGFCSDCCPVRMDCSGLPYCMDRELTLCNFG